MQAIFRSLYAQHMQVSQSGMQLQSEARRATRQQQHQAIQMKTPHDVFAHTAELNYGAYHF